jgi:hypothetical protein
MTNPNEAPSATAAALEALRRRRAELDRMASRLDAEGRNTLIEGEADARPMGIGKGPKRPSYNVQIAVDADTGLILHREVTTEPTDNRLLYPMAAAAKNAIAPWLQTLATQTAKTQPPASVKGLRHAFRQIVRLTIKATACSSTDPPSSISLRVTATHVRRAASWYANSSCAETTAFFTPLRTAPDVL